MIIVSLVLLYSNLLLGNMVVQKGEVSSSALFRSIEADFIELTNKHIEFWNGKEALHILSHITPERNGRDLDQKVSRPKRGGIEKIIQVWVVRELRIEFT